MGQFDKMFLSGTNLETVWNQIKKNFYPTSPDNTGPVAIRFTKDSNGIVTGITTSIEAGDISNSMLANSTITINNHAYNLGDTVTLDDFLSYLSANSSSGVVQLSGGKIPLSVFPDAVMGNVMFGGTVSTVEGQTYLSASLTPSAKRKIEQKMGYPANTLDNKTLRIRNNATTTVSGTIYTLGWEACEGVYFLWGTGVTSPETWAGSKFQVGDWLISIGAISSPETTGWKKIDNTDAVTSVNGETGAVVVPLNTAGANQSTSQLYLVGTTEQTTDTNGAQTYSNSKVYIKSNHLYSNSKQVVNLSDTQALTNKTYNGLTLTKATTGFTIAGGTTSKTLTVTEDTTLNGLYDQSSAHAAGTDGTGVVTERALYYALPTINDGHSYTSSSTFYAPTARGTKGYVLIGNYVNGTADSQIPIWTNKVFVDTTNSKVGINTDSPTDTLTVSGTASVSGNTAVGGTLTVSSTATFNGIVRLPYQISMQIKDHEGNYKKILAFNSNHNLVFGSETAQAGYKTYVEGYEIVLQVGTANTTEATLKSTGLTVVHDITSSQGNIQAAAGGVAAYGIADLAMGGGGGTGDVTSIQFGTADVIAPDNGLLSVPVGQGTLVGTVNIGGMDVPVNGWGSLGDLAFLDTITKTEHYSPTTEEYTPTAGSWTWGSTQVVTGITKDSKGHITGVTTTSISNPNSNTWRGIYVGGDSKVGTATSTKAINYVAGAGLSVSFTPAGTGGSSTGNANYFNVTFAHSNSVNAQTTQGLYPIAIDAQGHITGYSNAITKLSEFTDDLSANGEPVHTHTTTIAAGASGDTSQLTLAFASKYKLTAGGTNFIFTMPTAKVEHANGTSGTNTAHKITIGSNVFYLYFNSVETTDTDGNKLESFDITVSDKATPSASGANTKTFSFATMTKAQIESICTL